MELTVEVPLWVQRVVERPGRKDLVSHGHLTVRVTFTWRRQKEQINDLKTASEENTDRTERMDGRLEGYETSKRRGGVKKNKKILLLSDL